MAAPTQTDGTNGRRREAVEQRREIAAHRAKIAKLVEEALEPYELQRDFRSRFFGVCSTLSQHQASWAVDVEKLDYLESRSSTWAKCCAFFEWSRSALRAR